MNLSSGQGLIKLGFIQTHVNNKHKQYNHNEMYSKLVSSFHKDVEDRTWRIKQAIISSSGLLTFMSKYILHYLYHIDSHIHMHEGLFVRQISPVTRLSMHTLGDLEGQVSIKYKFHLDLSL